VSRIGKIPIAIPKGVDVKLGPGNLVAVKGPKGSISLDYCGHVVVKHEDGALLVERKSDEGQDRAYHGLYQRLLVNLVKGVTQGFQRDLELTGVGYRAAMDGTTLVLALGYSHEIRYKPAEGISLATPKPTQIVVTGVDKQKVGQAAANIRSFRPPEPYKGKGIRYAGEKVRRKVGKTGAK
jgi:large subunit ribosomal protein L6